MHAPFASSPKQSHIAILNVCVETTITAGDICHLPRHCAVPEILNKLQQLLKQYPLDVIIILKLIKIYYNHYFYCT